MLVLASLNAGSAPAFEGDAEIERATHVLRESSAARAARDVLLGLDPYLQRAYERAVELQQYEIFSHRRIGDLTGDGLTEIVADTWSLTSDPTGTVFFLTGTYSGTVLDGRTGKVKLTHEARFVDGFAGLTPFRVGPRGKPGLLAVQMTATSAAHTVRYRALTAGGDAVWTKLLPSTYNFNTGSKWYGPVGAATGALFTADRVDVRPGKATDVLLGRSDYVMPPRRKPVARTTVSVLDGRDGSITRLRSARSTEVVPVAAGLPDLNGDGSDDFALLTNGEADDGRVSAFDGRDASQLWTRRYALRPWSWTERIGNFVGGPTEDFLVSYDKGDDWIHAVVDGRTGRIGWVRKAIFPYVAGDIDDDGAPDLAGYRFGESKDAFLAYANDGRRLYEVFHGADDSGCGDSFCITFGFYLDAGDLDADGVRDTYVELSHSWNSKVTTYVVTGRTGRMLYTRKGIAPLRGSVDGSGDDLGRTHRLGSRRLAIEILDGRDLDGLWRATFVGRTRLRFADPWAPYEAAARLNEDACKDVVVSVRSGDAVTLVAMDGKDGSLLWRRRLTGARRGRIDVRGRGMANPAC